MTAFPTPPEAGGILARLGIHGYGRIEPVVLAALVSGDPLLLIGPSGTGKTLLLNRLAEALGLTHRHYNASLVAFDDLVGFPMPDAAGQTIRYLPTPATAWEAESILIDEINRCRPEHQNRFFSLIHERRLQGVDLPKLRYRWAAMNPLMGGDEQYVGTEPMDPALADRFAFLVEAPDWFDWEEADQTRILAPSGADLTDPKPLLDLLAEARARWIRLLAEPPASLLPYVRCCVEELAEIQVRISPRRARVWVRNALALLATDRLPLEQCYRLAVAHGLPQRAAGGIVPSDTQLEALHATAIGAAGIGFDAQWLTAFDRSTPGEQVRMLVELGNPDLAGVALHGLIRKMSNSRRSLLGLALYPLLMSLPGQIVSPDALADLAAYALPMLHVDKNVYFSAPAGATQSERETPEILIRVHEMDLEDARLQRFIHAYAGISSSHHNDAQSIDLYALEAEFNAYWQGAAAVSRDLAPTRRVAHRVHHLETSPQS